jgi:anti-sigma regulatory factor (Ser/Thr protein kinase)/class 3 adenylate cyclase
MICAGQRLGTGSHGLRYAPALEEAVRLAIREELARHDTRIGYASASAGPDIIFGEEVIARHGELRILLPCEEQDFIDQYVAPAGGSWTERFRALHAGAASVEVSCEERLLGDETLLRFNNQMLQGMGRIHAERLAVRPHLLLVWSPGAPPEPGSPADFMDQWPELEHLSLIDLDELKERLGLGVEYTGRFDDGSGFGTSPRAIRAILFADIATYTAFRDDQVPLLWDFLAEAQQIVETRAKPPMLINTWGDAVHAAAETAQDLADYATALADSVRTVSIDAFGLEIRPRLRIALHAGPVFVGIHPLTGRSMIYGHHVNRAARIEPVAAPGEIYASHHFAALLRSEMDAHLHEARALGTGYHPPYRLEYVGMLDLPKNFGREAIYRVARITPEHAEKVLATAALHLTANNDLAEIGRIGIDVEKFCADRELGGDIAHAINLSLDELLTNTISYGYDDEAEHLIDIAISVNRDRLTVTIRDDARPFDPTEAAAPDLDAGIDERPIGGLGIHLVRAMMDRVEYRYIQGHNELTLTKLLKT